nr:uncharacterized protein LOC127488803 [Oryctolagus cuniculus]
MVDGGPSLTVLLWRRLLSQVAGGHNWADRRCLVHSSPKPGPCLPFPGGWVPRVPHREGQSADCSGPGHPRDSGQGLGSQRGKGQHPSPAGQPHGAKGWRGRLGRGLGRAGSAAGLWAATALAQGVDSRECWGVARLRMPSRRPGTEAGPDCFPRCPWLLGPWGRELRAALGFSRRPAKRRQVPATTCPTETRGSPRPPWRAPALHPRWGPKRLLSCNVSQATSHTACLPGTPAPRKCHGAWLQAALPAGTRRPAGVGSTARCLVARLASSCVQPVGTARAPLPSDASSARRAHPLYPSGHMCCYFLDCAGPGPALLTAVS